MGDDPSKSALAEDISAALGPTVTVCDLRPLTSGASRQSWRFEARTGDRPPRPLVVQVAVEGTTGGSDGPLGMDVQARVLAAALEAGVRVAPVVASGGWGGRQYIISEWLPGEALPPKLLRDPDLEEGRKSLMDDCAAALASIHNMATDDLGLASQDRLGLYRDRLDQMGEARPVLELGHRWLVANRPPEHDPVVVVHGDFRLGNLLVGPNGLQAVLDWELTHLGDPHEDVAWATIRAWRFDRHRPIGVFPEPTAWVAAYNQAAGRDRELDPEILRWWQIAGTWTWAVMSAMQSRRHLDGWVQSLEHAVIGRRVCESEWDMMRLLP